MLQFDRVSFSYDQAPIIEEVSFHLPPQRLMALIGANGAGKSTIAQLANGLLKPSSGTVYVDGVDTKTIPTSELAKTVGFLFQNPDRQICQSTVKDEILFSLNCISTDKTANAARCMEILELFNLEANANPFSLGRGDRQKVALASVIACNPRLLIIDEPTTGMDDQSTCQLMDHLTALVKRETSILMITHDMELAADYATDCIVLRDGALIANGSSSKILSSSEMLISASLLPPTIPSLVSRLGEGFEHITTLEELITTLERRTPWKVC